MKSIVALLIFIFVSFVPNSYASDEDDTDRISAAICDYIKNDDRTSIRKKLKATNLDLRKVYTGLVCQPESGFSGGSLLRAASFYGSVDVSSFLIRLISVKQASFIEHDGKTTEQWLRQAIDGGTVTNVETAKSILSEYETKVSS